MVESEVLSLEENPKWIIDSSAATQHVNSNPNEIGLKSCFVTLMMATRGERHFLYGKRSIVVKFPNGEIKYIENIFYIPDIHCNLLSVGCMAIQGYVVEFIKDAYIIHDNEIHQIQSRRECIGCKGLYRLNAKNILCRKIYSLENETSVKESSSLVQTSKLH